MAVAGNSYRVVLSQTHLNWGTYRYGTSREFIPFEVYIPIPKHIAKAFQIYNSNYNNGADVFGDNIFNCTTFVDGQVDLELELKASGCSEAGDIYAKNLSGYDDLKALSPWIAQAGIVVGDTVEVRFVSSTDIELRKV